MYESPSTTNSYGKPLCRTRHFAPSGWRLALLLALFLSDDAIGFEDRNDYAGSEVCGACHAAEYALWRHSFHSRIYREPVDGAVLGDFDCEHGPGFDRADVAFVIGGHLEQMYAFASGDEHYVLPAKWLVRQQRWEAYHAADWQERPMRRKCHGCHIVGYDHRTGVGAEVNIGCEACHGPGAQHVRSQEPADSVTSVASEICGRCHSRGRNTADDVDFAYQFRPNRSDELDRFMEFSLPSGRADSYWWAGGTERNRHQEFLAFQQSGHRLALASLRAAPDAAASCLPCHSADGQHSDDLGTASHGVTCVSCHDPHASLLAGAANAVRACEDCHQRGAVLVHGGARSHSPCKSGEPTCVDCHMPPSGEGTVGFGVRSHTFRVVAPGDVPAGHDSCLYAGCHPSADAASLRLALDNRAPP